MSLIFSAMTEADAHDILAWRYEGVYAAYNTPDTAPDAAGFDYLAALLDTRSPYFAVRQAGHEAAPPSAFFAYGSACEVGDVATQGLAAPYLLRPDGSLTIGLGLRPDLTGQGNGLALVMAGLGFAREHYHPSLFRLYVYAWNERAIRVYTRADFLAVDEAHSARPVNRAFIEMTRPAL